MRGDLEFCVRHDVGLQFVRGIIAVQKWPDAVIGYLESRLVLF